MSRMVLLAALAVAGCERPTPPDPEVVPPPPPSPAPLDAGPASAPVTPDAAPSIAAPSSAAAVALPAATLHLVRRGMVVIGPAPRTAAIGPARLDLGEVPDVDSDSPGAYTHFAASRAVDPHRLGAAQRRWHGRTLRLGGPAVGCVAQVRELRVLGEIRTLTEDVATAGDDPGDVAADVLARDRPVLVGVLDADCGAAWAVPADAAPPRPVPRVGDRIAMPGGAPLELTVDDDGCPDHGSYRLVRGPDVLADEARAIEVRDTIDVDGDGWPEIVLADGWLARSAGAGDYQHVAVVDFPLHFYECIE